MCFVVVAAKEVRKGKKGTTLVYFYTHAARVMRRSMQKYQAHTYTCSDDS